VLLRLVGFWNKARSIKKERIKGYQWRTGFSLINNTVIDNLFIPSQETNWVFVLQESHDEKYNICQVIREYICCKSNNHDKDNNYNHTVHFVKINDVTNGSARTCMLVDVEYCKMWKKGNSKR